MQFQKLAIVLTTVALTLIAPKLSQAVDVKVGNIRVQTGRNGEMYVDTPRGRVYLPPDRGYYDDDYDDYEDDYDNRDRYDSYCSNRVYQRHSQRNRYGRQESYSRVYSRRCR